MSTGYRHAWDDSSLFVSSWDETERTPKLGNTDNHPWSPTKSHEDDMVQRLSTLSKENHELRIRSNKTNELQDEVRQLKNENDKLRKEPKGGQYDDNRKVWPPLSQLDAELSREKEETDRLRQERNDLKYQLQQIKHRSQSKQREGDQRDRLKEVISALRTEHEASLVDLRKTYEETIAQQRTTIKDQDAEIRMLRNGSAMTNSSEDHGRPYTTGSVLSAPYHSVSYESYNSPVRHSSPKRHQSPPKSPSRSLSPVPNTPGVHTFQSPLSHSQSNFAEHQMSSGDTTKERHDFFNNSIEAIPHRPIVHNLETRGRAGYHQQADVSHVSGALPRPVPALSGRGLSSGDVGVRGTSPAIPTRAQSAHTALPPRRGSASPGVGESDGVAQLGRLQQRHEEKQRERYTREKKSTPQMISSPLQKIDDGSGFYTQLTGRIHGSRRSESPGHVLAPNIFCGARVLRNPASWKWEDQDGGIGNLGTVIEVDDGWVVVSWDGIPKKNSYRWGHMGVFDVNIANKKPTGIVSPLNSNSPNPALGRSLSPVSMRNEMRKSKPISPLKLSSQLSIRQEPIPIDLSSRSSSSSS